MSNLTDLNIYKIAKVLEKEGPEVVFKLNRAIKDLTANAGFYHVRKLIRELDSCKKEMLLAIEHAKKVIDKKGRIK